MRIVLSMFFLIGLYAASVSLHGMWKLWDAESWQQTQGQIIKVDVVVGTNTSTVQVVYRYMVHGSTYVADRQYFGVHIATNSPTISYREGQAVTVFYNPSDASDAVLQPQDSHAIGFGMMLGIAFMGFAVFAFWFHRRHERKQG